MAYANHEALLAARARYRVKHRVRINADMKIYQRTAKAKQAAIARKAAYDARPDVIAKRLFRAMQRAIWALTSAQRQQERKRRQWMKSPARARRMEPRKRKVVLTPEQRREARRTYRENRKARQRGSQGQLSRGIRRKLLFLQRGKCAACLVKLQTSGPEKFHLDHIEPLALGGPHCDSNMQLLCQTCNTRKGAMPPIQFMQQLGNLI